jgi:hypothetical protein
MAQGRSTKIIYIFKWIRASRLSIKNCLSGLTDRVWVHALDQQRARDLVCQLVQPPLLLLPGEWESLRCV